MKRVTCILAALFTLISLISCSADVDEVTDTEVEAEMDLSSILSEEYVVQIEDQEEIVEEPKVLLYAADGRTVEVADSAVEDYLNVGWYETLEETQQTLYSADGETIAVYKAEVSEYLNSGWYETKPEPKQTLYAADGRTITVNQSAVEDYLNVGWYETQSAAQAAKKTANSSSSTYNPEADGNYYRTPTGKRYHLDPNCGGKNSYKTNNISGLSPCKKCAG